MTAEFDDDSLETIHLTQVALGEKPKAGPHTIFIEKDGEQAGGSVASPVAWIRGALRPMAAPLARPTRRRLRAPVSLPQARSLPLAPWTAASVPSSGAWAGAGGGYAVAAGARLQVADAAAAAAAAAPCAA